MKACSNCGDAQPLTEFYRHKGCADGHVGQCKRCVNKKSSEYQKTDAGRASAKKSNQTDASKARHKTFIQSDAGKAAMARAAKRFAETHPKQVKANYTFRNAVRLGKVIPMPCMVCGKAKAEGHHPDYDQPLSVVWLCRPHHLEVHSMAKQLGK